MKKKAIVFILVIALICGVTAAFATSRNMPFVDVPSDAWYADDVAWAAENGITNGTDATHFSPDKVCTRAEMVTFLHRLAQSIEEKEQGTNVIDPDPTPEPTTKPRTLADMPYDVPHVEQRIVPEYANYYYGRLTIGGIYSVGLYDTLDKELVDSSDAGFWMKRRGGCQMVGDHDSEGMWIIRWCGPGDTLEIKKKDGEYQKYTWIRTDPHVRNMGSDVWDSNGESLYFMLPESGLILCCCNDSEGKDMTATFWRRTG